MEQTVLRKPIMVKVNGDGVKIQIAVWEGEGREILCVHGLSANCRCWDSIASALSPQHKDVLPWIFEGEGFRTVLHRDTLSSTLR